MACGYGSPVCNRRSRKDSGAGGSGVRVSLPPSDLKSQWPGHYHQSVRRDSRQSCGSSGSKRAGDTNIGDRQCGWFLYSERSGLCLLYAGRSRDRGCYDKGIQYSADRWICSCAQFRAYQRDDNGRKLSESVLGIIGTAG